MLFRSPRECHLVLAQRVILAGKRVQFTDELADGHGEHVQAIGGDPPKVRFGNGSDELPVVGHAQAAHADSLHHREAAEKRGRKNLYGYFVANQLVNLLEDIGEF